MFKKLIITIISVFLFSFNVHAGSSGDLAIEKERPQEIKDCFEKLNRATFAFNNALDGIIFKPVASVYKVLPSPVRTGVSNSLDNLSSLVTIPNNVLQGDFSKAGVNTGRFLINTTIGLLGLIDVATYLGLEEYEKEDYGQSLAKHGVGPGCYIVLPVLGPSTARDTVATTFNFLGGDPWYNVTVKNDTQYVSHEDYYISKVTGGVDFRAKNYNSIENLKKNSVDFYASVKSLYLQDRKKRIANSDDITETMDDSDWEEIETQ